MRKIFIILIGLLLLFNLGNTSWAESSMFQTISIDGQSSRLRTVNVLIDDQELISDVPPILYKDRTLVPIRFVAEKLGAQVSWNGETSEALIETESKEIVLKLNSSTVRVNGINKKIPYNVPAKLVNNARTMVPLRFVSEELGCEVGWNSSTYTGIIKSPKENEEVTKVKDIHFNNDTKAIEISTTGRVQYSDIELENPSRLVVDIKDSKLDIEEDKVKYKDGMFTLDVEEHPIETIRISQFSKEPYITRMVIDLEEMSDYKIKAIEDNVLSISFDGEKSDEKDDEEEQIEEDQEQEENEDTKGFNIIEKRINGKEAIVIENIESDEYNLFTLDKPKRIVLDIFNEELDSNLYTYDIETDIIKGIRASQFDPDSMYDKGEKILRVVFDIKEDLDYDLDIEKDQGRIVAFIGDKSFDEIEYTNSKEYNFLKLKTLGETDQDISYDAADKQMNIVIPKEEVDIKNGILSIGDEYIDNMEVYEKDDNKIIKVNFNKNISYQFSVGTYEILIGFKEAKEVDTKFSDKLIVIDAGHGGRAPGTTGPITKVREKDLSLNVALKLEKKLKNMGFKTLMTRDSDEYVGLYDRTDMANENNADAFVSIHFNAHPSSAIAGIQTLYCPSYESDVKNSDNYPFAETIHEALLEGLKRKDMDIIRRPDLVVTRETAMVSALVELGFVTNPQEERIIITDEYHEKAAEAIASGLVNYFSK
ncbi:N-acetylmuramoyl-L-alanine amidase [Dethiothermospora halolimnae]|uniref:N-acetylmuramoyl-L-alanine amidase n=1 Tax=Dethiothermospora halolimnae TaxID=3114390 RepID=UPI003CCC2DC0